MAKVYNWQLGREMNYRFEQAAPQWQFAAAYAVYRARGAAFIDELILEVLGPADGEVS